MKSCWEVKRCEREPGGLKTAELGICPAAKSGRFNGKNNGEFAGRYCWKVAGTLCGGKVQGSHASKIMNCASCDFFSQIKKEEGAGFSI